MSSSPTRTISTTPTPIDNELYEFDENSDPHDNEDYECEECGDCDVCCELGDCTSKNPFSNQGQWVTTPGLYISCPHCEPYDGADRPVMPDERYGCTGYPGTVDKFFLTCVPVEELVNKGLFVQPKK
jgi:hypothetical protein